LKPGTQVFDQRTRDALRRLEWQIGHRNLGSPFGGHHRSTFRGRGMEFDEVVKYAYGDDIRDVDWNVTARRGEPYRKVFSEEREATIFVIVNDDPALQFGSDAVAKRDVLLELAGLMLMLAVVHRERAALLHVTPRGETFIPPTRVRSRIAAAIGTLFASTPPDPTSSPKASASPLLGSCAPKGALIAYFGEIPSSIAPLQWAALRRRHAVFGVRVEDEWERSGAGIERFMAYDPTTCELVWVTDSAEARSTHDAWRASRERIWQSWWPNAAERLSVDTTQDPLSVFARFLRTR
jgi:uncharacterized protein (DUF58 family)